MVFLEAERFRLIRLAAGYWGKRSTQPGDLPPGVYALRLPRAVNAHALDVLLRYSASQMTFAFFIDIALTILNSMSITYYVSSIKYSLAILNT